MSAREEIKNLGTHLDTTQNKFQQLKVFFYKFSII